MDGYDFQYIERDLERGVKVLEVLALVATGYYGPRTAGTKARMTELVAELWPPPETGDTG